MWSSWDSFFNAILYTNNCLKDSKKDHFLSVHEKVKSSSCINETKENHISAVHERKTTNVSPIQTNLNTPSKRVKKTKSVHENFNKGKEKEKDSKLKVIPPIT